MTNICIFVFIGLQQTGIGAFLSAAKTLHARGGENHLRMLHLRHGHALIPAATGLLLPECRAGTLLSIHQDHEGLQER